jgi:DNA gyrase subunit A
VAEVSQLGRNTQGVTLIRLPAEETLVSVMRLEAEEGNGDEPGEGDAPTDGAGPSADLPAADE